MDRSRVRNSSSDIGRAVLRVERQNLTPRPKTTQPVMPRVHHWWTLPLEVVLAAVLTVPGPGMLADAEVRARRQPPRPQTRRSTPHRAAKTDPRRACEQGLGPWRRTARTSTRPGRAGRRPTSTSGESARRIRPAR
jgi:hypothetical protein